jgi:hypothetical protein
MNFKEKIDNILKTNKKKFSSIGDLETAAGLGMNTLRKAYNENREPSPKVVVKLLEGIGINEEWWDTGKGAILGEKRTLVQKASERDEKMDEIKDEIIELLREKVARLEGELAKCRSGK